MSLCEACIKTNPIIKKETFTLIVGTDADTAEFVRFTDLATGRVTLVPALVIYTTIGCDITDELSVNHSYKVELLDDTLCAIDFDIANCDISTTTTNCATFYYVAAGACSFDELDVQTLTVK
jgi:hypothetical protein